jgi:hypothetical protein
MIRVIRKDFVILPDKNVRTPIINRTEIAFISRVDERYLAYKNLGLRSRITLKGGEELYSTLTTEELELQIQDAVFDDETMTAEQVARHS